MSSNEVILTTQEPDPSRWSVATPATSSLGSLLALTGALAGAGAGAGQGAEPHQRLDPDYLDQYRRAFDEFDLDGDGKISTQVQQEI